MFVGNLRMLKSANESVLSDDISTEKAQRAHLTADRLLKWIERNDGAAVVFASNLVRKFHKCCTHPRGVTCHTLKEHMWEKYHKLCSSDEFRTDWLTSLQSSIGFQGSAIFYQFTTKVIMKQIIKIQFPVMSTPVTMEVTKLDYEESNALRYCVGYNILRSVRKKIDKSAHDHPMTRG